MNQSDSISLEEIKSIIKTKKIGCKIEYYPIIGSTNDIARKLAIAGSPEGTVIIAGIQTRGRGRLGRKWLSSKGGIWLSIILKPKMLPNIATIITSIVGIAVHKTLCTDGIDLRLKWPNDIMVDDKKLGGILTEIGTELNTINYLLIGVGINVNNNLSDFPAEIRDKVTTLKVLKGTELSRAYIISQFLEEFEDMYNTLDRGEYSTIFREWKNLSDTLGRKVKVVTENKIYEGVAMDIDADGSLVLKLNDTKKISIIAGDCIHLNEKI
jgi:BirA family biotin operon repressor/biotin-[acetyl-CoA-carboxylase] ligase